jgi:hypothetical protein
MRHRRASRASADADGPSKPDPTADARRERKRSRRLKAEFDVVHQRGMDALRTHDYPTVGEAIEAEARILDEHQQLVKTHVARAKAVVKAGLNLSRRIVKKR